MGTDRETNLSKTESPRTCEEFIKQFEEDLTNGRFLGVERTAEELLELIRKEHKIEKAYPKNPDEWACLYYESLKFNIDVLGKLQSAHFGKLFYKAAWRKEKSLHARQ